MNRPDANKPAANDLPDEKPPILGTWPRLYAFVLIYLAAVIFLCWLFTRHYAPAS
jgi:hypothetical protein